MSLRENSYVTEAIDMREKVNGLGLMLEREN